MFNNKLYKIKHQKTPYLLQEQISHRLILSMKYINSSFEEINIDEKLCLTIGNFDGIHKGHREIIKNLIQKTKISKSKRKLRKNYVRKSAKLFTNSSFCPVLEISRLTD